MNLNILYDLKDSLSVNQEQKRLSGYIGKRDFKAKRLKRGQPVSDQLCNRFKFNQKALELLYKHNEYRALPRLPKVAISSTCY